MPYQNPWKTAGLGTVLRPGSAIGNVYYVDGDNGSDDNHGLDPMVPVRTITYALSLCTNDGNDVIVVLDYPEAGGIEAATPVVISKDRVHILGSAYGHERADKFIFLSTASDDTAFFDIQARNVEIAYFKLACGVSHGSIQFGGAGVASKAAAIHHCTFGQKNAAGGAPAYGINFGATASWGNWCYIGYNFFGSSITSHGITIPNNPAHVRIERNVFYHVGGDGINIAGDGNFGLILDNQFSLFENAAGRAITFTAAAAGEGWFIDGNSANFGVTAMAANPYRDLSVGAAKQDWGMNHKGNTHVMPAVA